MKRCLINRDLAKGVEKHLQIFPAVAVLGSRQCGKSTLIRMLAQNRQEFIFLDLQDRKDRQKLEDPVLFFKNNENRIVCLDEVQLMPDLFEYLRVEIDRLRRPGRFVLLGSASRELLQQTSETLAGRIGLLDLTPFLLSEISRLSDFDLLKYWYRGGYPDSYLAISDEASALWRENFLRTYIERDIPQLGFQIAAPTMMRLLTLLAHEHGSVLNTAKLGNAMDLSAPTIRHYIDILEQTYIVRILPPHFRNIRKRLVKTPRLYFRDSGLLHQTLDIQDFNSLAGNPIYGFSWEGMVIENVCASIKNAKFSFYRSANGSEEMDLLLEYADKLVAIECKASTAPNLSDGFWRAIDTLQPQQTYVVCPIEESYAIKENVEIVGLLQLLEKLQNNE